MNQLPISVQPLRVASTGGNSGLGLALTEALDTLGDMVDFVARNGERVAGVARATAGSHGIVGDLARKDDIHAIALQIGGALVNNASSLGPVPLSRCWSPQSFVACSAQEGRSVPVWLRCSS